MRACATCGTPNPEEARFCQACGAPSAPAPRDWEQRKTVTVLFADVTGSTALGEALDPESLRRVMSRFFMEMSSILQRHGGSVEKFIGDAVMAVFGLQQVHEDDALRAVRAGLAIRDRARRLSEELELGDALEVRVGIEAGEAATGTGPSEQLLVTGSVVNAAARLQAAADPSEVLVGVTAHALTESAVAYAETRDVVAKGFEAPLQAHPVEGLTTRSVRRTIPFVGRADELRRLRERFDRIVAAREPALVTVVGEAGSGKSRLADELVAGLGPGVAVLHGRGEIASGSATFAPVATIVRQLAGIGDHEAPGESAARLRELVDGCCDANETERVAASLGLTLGLNEPGLDESAFVQDVRAGVTRLVRGLARASPVVLLIEDAHELAPAMLDLVEGLASRPDLGAVLVIALTRPGLREARAAWGAEVPTHETVPLSPLAPGDAVELVRQAGGDRISGDVAASLAERAGGNPFFIVEMTGMVLQEGPSTIFTVPPTVQAVVAARIDALTPAARTLARRVSIFFVSFDVDEVRAIAGDDEPEVKLRELEEAELLVPTDDGAPRWRFRHATLRDVAYASLPKRERMELHVVFADRLLADGHRTWAAEHLERAAFAARDLDPSSRALAERARDALAEAGDRARRRMENHTALERYERALVMAGGEADWGVAEARVLAGMGEARYWLGDFPAASEALDRAAALGERLGDGWTLTHALRFLGDIAINVHADLDHAERLLARSLEAAEAIDDPPAITRTLLFAGWVPWTRGQFDEAEVTWRRALAIAEEHHDRWAEVRALTALSIGLVDQGRIDESESLIERARGTAVEMGDRFSAAVATVQEGRILEERGDFQASLLRFDRGIEIFTDLGNRWELGDALAERGIAYRELDRLDEAERDLREAIRISEELGERQLAGWTWKALARVSERRGDAEQAAEHQRRADEEEARRPR